MVYSTLFMRTSFQQAPVCQHENGNNISFLSLRHRSNNIVRREVSLSNIPLIPLETALLSLCILRIRECTSLCFVKLLCLQALVLQPWRLLITVYKDKVGLLLHCSSRFHVLSLGFLGGILLFVFLNDKTQLLDNFQDLVLFEASKAPFFLFFLPLNEKACFIIEKLKIRTGETFPSLSVPETTYICLAAA